MKVLIATAMYPSPERPYVGTFVRSQVDALRAAGVDVDVFVVGGNRRKLKYLAAVSTLRRRLRSGGHDLVHAHYSYVGFVARTQARVPVVVTYHGSDLLGVIRDADGGISVRSRVEARAARALARSVDAAIVQTGEMARTLSGGNVHIIPHEVDLDLFRPHDHLSARRQLGLDASRRYVLFAADPALHVKNYPLADSAVAAARRRGVDAELLVVHEETQERLALYMSACDALVFPSFLEGSPNVVKQAMACNLPVVATDVGDVRDVIGGTDGCRVCAATPEDFADALCDVLRSPRRTDGRTAMTALTPDRVAARVVSVYESILARRSRPVLTPDTAGGG